MGRRRPYRPAADLGYTRAMPCSRRDSLVTLAYALFATPVLAAAAPAVAPLPSHVYPFADLPVHGGGNARSRPVLHGLTHSKFFIEIHETDLAPGARPHPPHHHLHEEVFFMRQGQLEVTVAGQSATIGPGSVAYIASNQEHGIRNVGSDHAQYFVLALGTDVKAGARD